MVDLPVRECVALKVVSTMVDIAHEALTGRFAAPRTRSKVPTEICETNPNSVFTTFGPLKKLMQRP